MNIAVVKFRERIPFCPNGIKFSMTKAKERFEAEADNCSIRLIKGSVIITTEGHNGVSKVTVPFANVEWLLEEGYHSEFVPE